MHDPGTLAELQGRYGTRHRWLMLMTVMIGFAFVLSMRVHRYNELPKGSGLF